MTKKADSGCLIFENPVPEDITLDVNQIFDLFYKADTARRKGSSGLGMFIVRELMRRMGGDVDAELTAICCGLSCVFRPMLPSLIPGVPTGSF